ncbi:hypothetical protein Tco_0295282 [Tanacetum coccineum]
MSTSQDLRDSVFYAILPPDIGARISSASLFPKCQEQCSSTVVHDTQGSLSKETLKSFLPKKQMAGPVEGGGPEGTDDQEETPPPLTKEHIKGHVPALKSLIKNHNQRNKGDPIRLDFKLEDTEVQGHDIVKGKEVVDEDLRKSFKEARKIPLTRDIIEFAGPEYKMPTNIKLYDGTTDPEDILSPLRTMRLTQDNGFIILYGVNVSTKPFIWVSDVKRFFIMDVSEVMKISSFMDAVKSPELAKRFSNKVHATVNEMMERLDDFVRSEEAYANTELPKGETRETHRKAPLPFNRRDSRLFCNTHPGDSRRSDYRNSYREENANPTNIRKQRDYRAPYPQPRGEYHNRVAPVLTLDSLTKRPKEILATETSYACPNSSRPCLNPSLKFRKHELILCISSRKNPLYKRLYPAKEAVRNGAGIKEVGSPSESRTTNRKRESPRQGCSPTSKDNQCEVSKPLGKIELEVCLGNSGLCRRTSIKFIVVRAPLPYNIILGRSRLKTLRSIPSTIHSMMKFPTPKGMATLVNRTVIIVECKRLEKKQMMEEESSEGGKEVELTEVLGDGTWRMCIDSKNLNSACPKDYYPLPNIDCKVESVMGFKYKCFLDPYKGYHQIQMAEEDEEKTTFYTDILLHQNAIQAKKHRGYVPEAGRLNVPALNQKKLRGICG